MPVAGNLAVGREDNERPYSLSAMPVSRDSGFGAFANDHVLILLADPDAAPPRIEDVLRRHDGLSARQARIVLLIASGHRLGDCTEALGIAEKTVRRHLEVIFARTGLHRQVDLVRLVLSIPGRPFD